MISSFFWGIDERNEEKYIDSIWPFGYPKASSNFGSEAVTILRLLGRS